MKISIGTVILAGGAAVDEQPYDFSISNTRLIQMANTIRGETTQGFDRGNQRTSLEFRVVKRHESAEAAETFVIEHAAQLKNLGTDLVITEEPSQQMYTLNDAVISTVECSFEGIASFHFYKIIGGNFRRYEYSE